MHCRPSPFLEEIRGKRVIEETYEELMNTANEKEDVGRAIRTAQGAIGQTLTHFVAEAVVSTEFDRRLIQGPLHQSKGSQTTLP